MQHNRAAVSWMKSQREVWGRREEIEDRAQQGGLLRGTCTRMCI
jgi:hypothetical protein